MSGRRIRGARNADEAEEPPAVELSTWVAGIARRVEMQVRSDWTLIPALRNLLFRFMAINARLIAATYKYKTETEHDFMNRLVQAIQKVKQDSN